MNTTEGTTTEAGRHRGKFQILDSNNETTNLNTADEGGMSSRTESSAVTASAQANSIVVRVEIARLLKMKVFS